MSQEVADATKAVAENGPFLAKNLVPTLWMAAVAALGGAVSFIQKVKAGKARAFNIIELIGEMLISGFVGVVTYWICQFYNVNPYLTAAGVAIAGHMGTRAIFLGEEWFEQKMRKFFKA